ncbi:MAG: hypothetical protein Kow0063_11390 [Anaerolineae bacterium]
MNWVDIVFLAILTGALLWGMLRGIGAQLISLLSIILAGIVAALFYPDLADLSGRLLSGVSRPGRETVAFLFLLIATSNLTSYTLRSSVIPPEERRRRTETVATGLEGVLASGTHRFLLAPLYMLGSMVLAVALTCVWFGLVTWVLHRSLALPWPAYNGIRTFLYNGLYSSTVARLLSDAFETAYTSVMPVLLDHSYDPLITLMRRFSRLPWTL